MEKINGKKINETRGVIYMDLSTGKPLSINSYDEVPSDDAFPQTDTIENLRKFFPDYELNFLSRPVVEPPEEIPAIPLHLQETVNNPPDINKITQYLAKLEYAFSTATPKNKKVIAIKIEAIKELLEELHG